VSDLFEIEKIVIKNFRNLIEEIRAWIVNRKQEILGWRFSSDGDKCIDITPGDYWPEARAPSGFKSEVEITRDFSDLEILNDGETLICLNNYPIGAINLYRTTIPINCQGKYASLLESSPKGLKGVHISKPIFKGGSLISRDNDI